MLRKFLQDRRGLSSSLISLYITFLFVLIFMLIYDVGFLYIKKEKLNDALKFSNITAYKEIDIDKLREGELYLDYSKARDTFEETLQDLLMLDSEFLPNSAGSPAAGKVEIVSFIVRNNNEHVIYDTLGNELNNLSIHSRVKMPVKPLFIGLFGDHYEIEAAVTTDAPFIELTSP